MLLSLKHLQILCLTIDILLIWKYFRAMLELIFILLIVFFALEKISVNPEKTIENLQKVVQELYELYENLFKKKGIKI